MNSSVPDRFSLEEASKMTGLEPSRIRYFQQSFKEYFDFTEADLNGRAFDREQVEMLNKITTLLTGEGLSVGEVRQALAQSFRKRRNALRIISVTSGKGGVGKTTVSLNLAITMARSGLKTLIFDADLGLANVHVLAGMNPKYTFMDLLKGTCLPEQTLTEGPGGVRVLCGLSGVYKAANLDQGARELIARKVEKLALGFDVVIVDTAAGVGENVLHFLDYADDVVVVATPNTASILDAYGVIKVARERRVSGRIQVLMNQVKDEREAHSVFDNITACSRRFLQFSPHYLGCLYEDPKVEVSIRKREPFVIACPVAANTAVFKEVAAELMPRSNKREIKASDDGTERDLVRFFLGNDLRATVRMNEAVPERSVAAEQVSASQ